MFNIESANYYPVNFVKLMRQSLAELRWLFLPAFPRNRTGLTEANSSLRSSQAPQVWGLRVLKKKFRFSQKFSQKSLMHFRENCLRKYKKMTKRSRGECWLFLHVYCSVMALQNWFTGRDVPVIYRNGTCWFVICGWWIPYIALGVDRKRESS